jgi:hypothetical protein
VWYLSGPNQAGWARRSGTPTALLLGGSQKSESAASISQTSLPTEMFNGTLRGRLEESGPRSDGLLTIAINAQVRGKVRGILRITLWGLPADGGGVALTASDVAFGATGTTFPYLGKVVSLAGDRVDAQLADASGRQLTLSVGLRRDRATGGVTGEVRGRAS